MSVIRVDSVGPSAGGTTKNLIRSTAAAWVNFNGTGTIAARDSENVSSLTDNGTGDYTVNFSNAFGAGDYVGTSSQGRGAGGGGNFGTIGPNTVDPTTTAYRFVVYDSGFSLSDAVFAHLVAHGDLA